MVFFALVRNNKLKIKELFQKLEKCKDVYLQVFYEGRELSKMTVCT